MSLKDLIDSQIQDAIAAGAFDNLPGAGKPLRSTDMERLRGRAMAAGATQDAFQGSQ